MEVMSMEYLEKSWLRRIGKMLVGVLVIIALLCGFFYVIQDGMIFYQVMDEQSRSFLQGRTGFREVQFTGTNGKTYHGMMYMASDELAPLIIYFGGNAEVSYRTLRSHEEREQWQYFPGFHYLFVDYEGYGLNDGSPHYLNMYEQALAVYEYATTLPSVDKNRIVAMGYSLGTGSAVYLAAHRPVAGLLLATPYANGYDLYNNVIPIFHGPMRLLVKHKFPSDRYAPAVTCPVLIIASRADEIIPYSSSVTLSGLFNSDVDFMTLENALHNHVFQARGVFERVEEFLLTH
jgi:pimeloyl-ACP methyl ester carboxylesterase